MKVAVFDTRRFDREAITAANAAFNYEIAFFEERLKPETARLAEGCAAVCPFVNDTVSRATLKKLATGGTMLIAMRSAGYNNVDLAAATDLGFRVVRVPEYSPYAVAEHVVAMILGLNRKIIRSSNRVRDGNFSLEGLVGFDLHGKTMGIVGTGKIGAVLARIMSGFGCRVLAYDVHPDEELTRTLGVKFVPLAELLQESDIVSLHVPLVPGTMHLMNAETFSQMKRGAILINTGRGGLIDTPALVGALKSRQIGAAGLDVYEEEAGVFHRDLSGEILQDDVLARLLTFPNVLITAHQAYLTREALANIAETTLGNIRSFEHGAKLVNVVGN